MNEKAMVIDRRKVTLRARVRRGWWSTRENRGSARKGGGKRRNN